MKQPKLGQGLLALLALISLVVCLVSYNHYNKKQAELTDSISAIADAKKAQTQVKHQTKVVDNTTVDPKVFYAQLDGFKKTQQTILDLVGDHQAKGHEDALKDAQVALKNYVDPSEWLNPDGVLIKNYRTDHLTIEASYTPDYSPTTQTVPILFFFNNADGNPVYTLDAVYHFDTKKFSGLTVSETRYTIGYVKEAL